MRTALDSSLRSAVMDYEIDALSIGLTLERYKDQSEAGQGAGICHAQIYGNRTEQKAL